MGKGFWCPAATNEVERTRTRRQKKKLWVQGLYRLRRHGGDRVLSCIKSHLVKNLSGPCGHCDTKESHKWYDAPHLHLTLGVEHGKVDAFTLKNAILIYTDLHVLHCELRFLRSRHRGGATEVAVFIKRVVGGQKRARRTVLAVCAKVSSSSSECDERTLLSRPWPPSSEPGQACGLTIPSDPSREAHHA